MDNLFRKVGIPSALISDNAPELAKGEFRRKAKRAQCPMSQVEVDTQNANMAKTAIRELKRQYRRVMLEIHAPEVVWDSCLEWCAMVRSHTAVNIRSLDGQVPATKISGDTMDISQLAEFGFHDWVWFVDTKHSDSLEMTGEPSMQKKRIGKYLGPAESVGSAMCGVVLTEKGTRLDKASIFSLSLADKNSDQVKDRKHNFTTVHLLEGDRLGYYQKKIIGGIIC